MKNKKIALLSLFFIPFVFSSCKSSDTTNDTDKNTTTTNSTVLTTTSNYIVTQSYSDIIIDTNNCTKEFLGQRFSLNGIKVYGVSDIGNIRLSDSEYTYELYFNDIKVDSFLSDGNYKVSIIVVDNDVIHKKEYTVSYEYKEAYSVVLNTDLVKKEFVEEEFSYENLVVNLKNETSNELISTNDYSISLNYNNEAVDEFYESGTYEVIVKYTGDKNVVNVEGKYNVSYVAPAYVSTKNEIPLTVTYNSNTEIVVELIKEDEATITDYHVSLSDDNSDFSVSITSDKQTISNLSNSTTYTISGYVLENDSYYKIKNKTINLSLLGSFNEQSFNDALLTDAGNMMDVSVKPFKDAAPLGYELAGFIVYKGEQIIDEIEITNNTTSIYLDNLSGLTEYRLSPFYDKVIEAKGLKRPPTEGYRIFFYGVTFLTKSAIKYRIRMMYNEECLYTYYVGLNDTLRDDNIYTFELPLEYEGATIVADPRLVSKVTENVDLDIKLRFPTDNGPYNVFYVPYAYDNNWSDKYYRVDYEMCDYGATLVGTDVIPSDYVKYDSTDREYYSYQFVRWDMPSEPVTSDLIVYAQYNRELYRRPNTTTSATPSEPRMDIKSMCVDYEGGFVPTISYSGLSSINYQIYCGTTLVKDDVTNRAYNTGLTPGLTYDLVITGISTIGEVRITNRVSFTVPSPSLAIAGALDVNPRFYEISVVKSPLVYDYKIVDASRSVNALSYSSYEYISVVPSTSYKIYYSVTDPLNNKIIYVYDNPIEVTTLDEPTINLSKVEIITSITYDEVGGGYVESENEYALRLYGNMTNINHNDLPVYNVYFRLESGNYTNYHGYNGDKTDEYLEFIFNSEDAGFLDKNELIECFGFVVDVGDFVYYYDVDFYGFKISTVLRDVHAGSSDVTPNGWELILSDPMAYEDDTIALKRTYYFNFS